MFRRQSAKEKDEADRGRLAERVLSSSGVMVGACATLVGLVKLLEPNRGASRVDEYAGLTATGFVLCSILAYLALRLRGRPVLQARLEMAADILFLVGMVALAFIGIMFAYDVI